MQAVEIQHYLTRARDFLKGVNLLKDDLAEYKFSSALLAIHSAISYSDALRIGLGDSNLSSENHQNATKELKRLLTLKKCERLQGVDRLDKLLGKKSRIAYAPDLAGEQEFKSIILDAERFASWVEITATQLKIEGW